MKMRKDSRPLSDTTDQISEEERRRLGSYLVVSMKDVQPVVGNMWQNELWISDNEHPHVNY